MTTGQKIICINDSFHGPIRKLYAQLPVKGVEYTIRAVFVGRSIAFGKPGKSDGEIGLLLEGVNNPIDPRCKNFQELGFSSTRFAEAEEITETQQNALQTSVT